MTECECVNGKPFYDQNWCEYDALFIDFTIQYTQLMLGYIIKKGVFSFFPYNLPPYHLFPTLGLKTKVLRDEMIQRGIDTSKVDAEMPPEVLESLNSYKVEELTEEQQQVSALFNSFMSMSRYGLKMEEHTFPEFESIHIAQNMISICSIAEGFIVSCLTYLLGKDTSHIIKHYPKEDIKRNRSAIVDKAVFNLTRKSFVKNLLNIENTLNLSFGISEKQKIMLEDLFLIRNLYVHNNGVVNGHFKKMTTKYKAANQGDKFALTENEVEKMLDNLTDTMYLFYKSTSIGCLGKFEKQLVKGPVPLIYA